MESSSQTARMLGEVQGSLSALSKSMDRVLDNQETARAEVIAATDKLHAKIDEHSTSDTESFAAIRNHVGEGLGGLRDRIAQLEPLVDRVESQGDAITSIETRLTDADAERKSLEAARAVNRRWQKGMIATAGIVAGAFGSAHGAALVKWVETLAH